MPDLVEIAVPDGDAPVSYVLAGNEGFAPETIEATFDGSSAAGDFVPCCTLYAQDGRKLARTFPSETMVSGDVSGVTFAPF